MSNISPTSRLKTVTVTDAHCLTIYIPIARRKVAERSIAFAKARTLAGGWTTRFVAGGWIDPQGAVIQEPVDEHVFYVPADVAPAVLDYFRAVAQDLLLAGEQAVLIVHAAGSFTITQTLTH